MGASAHALAMVAAARDDLKRCRAALEALAVTFDRLLDPAGLNLAEGLTVDAKAGRPAIALAAALVHYLEAGGQLPADLATDLSQELAASRRRRPLDAL